MLHVFAFCFFASAFVVTMAGISLLLAEARDEIERALRHGVPALPPIPVAASRVRVLRRAGGRRVMQPLRAAA